MGEDRAKIGTVWLATVVVALVCATTPEAATITVDGDDADWSGIAALTTDPLESGSATDLLSLRVTDDGTNVYFLVEYAGDPATGDNFLHLDTDRDGASGCTLFGFVGSEYWITFSTFRDDYIGDARDCLVNLQNPADWFDGALTTAYGPTFVEAAVPIAILEQLTPGLDGFDVLTANDFTSASYDFAGPPAPRLAIGGSCPGTLTIDVTDATPGATLAVLGSTAAGNFAVPLATCTGTQLGLASPVLLGVTQADQAGGFSFQRSVSSGFCGRLIQVIEAPSCATSNVDSVP